MPYKDRDRQRQYQREYVARVRQEWIQSNGPCARCGSWDSLEVDHVDPRDKVSHAVWSWSLARREAELKKCQVLCNPCHVDKTAQENSDRLGGRRHGTEAEYARYKCRCEQCRLARSLYRKELRAKRKALGLPYQ